MKRTRLLLIANLVSVLYLGTAYLLMFPVLFSSGNNTAEEWGNIAGLILYIFVIPHLFLFTVGLVLGWVAYVKNSVRLALASFLFYTFGTLILMFAFLFGLPSTILAFASFRIMTKEKKTTELNAV
jgi:hypothetical protein